MIHCPYRSLNGDQSVCRIVSEIMDRPLPECHVNDEACEVCLSCGIAPQAPNRMTASMAIGVAQRTGDMTYMQATMDRMRHVLLSPAEPQVTTCVLRGPEVRKVACKPCQADSRTPVNVPVFRCPRHVECTLHNTGTFPKIQACATCQARLPEYIQLEARPLPAAVIAAIVVDRSAIKT